MLVARATRSTSGSRLGCSNSASVGRGAREHAVVRRLGDDASVTPATLHDFFVASAGVAGALIGLLFVAVSVSHERLVAEDSEHVHRLRASAALTSFTNALAISLFALVPGVGLGATAFVVGALGLLFVTAMLLSVVRVRKAQPVSGPDLLFLVGLVATCGLEVLYGIELASRGHDPNSADTIAVLAIVCFLIGVARSWELVGGPSFGFFSEVRALLLSAPDKSDPAA
jgi:hypothetical protein